MAADGGSGRGLGRLLWKRMNGSGCCAPTGGWKDFWMGLSGWFVGRVFRFVLAAGSGWGFTIQNMENKYQLITLSGTGTCFSFAFTVAPSICLAPGSVGNWPFCGTHPFCFLPLLFLFFFFFFFLFGFFRFPVCMISFWIGASTTYAIQNIGSGANKKEYTGNLFFFFFFF